MSQELATSSGKVRIDWDWDLNELQQGAREYGCIFAIYITKSEDSPDSSCDGSTYLFGRYWVSEMPLSSSERFRKVRVT